MMTSEHHTHVREAVSQIAPHFLYSAWLLTIWDACKNLANCLSLECIIIINSGKFWGGTTPALLVGCLASLWAVSPCPIGGQDRWL